MPNWILEIARKLNLVPLYCKEIPMGVVADVWRVYCKEDKEYIFKRSKFSGLKSLQIAKQLNKAKDKAILPLTMSIFVEQEYLYVTYIMIKGEVQEDFNICTMKKIFDLLYHIHENLGFYSVPSIYNDIINHAEEVLKSNKIINLGDVDIIKGSACRILEELSESKLNDMLQCRGHLTHGDIKPNNVIMSKEKQLYLIDWEKICSVSPEFDLVYGLLYGRGITLKNISIKERYNYNIFCDCLNYIHDLHLIYDCYVFIRTGKRYEYIKREVLPLYASWEKNRFKYMEMII